MHERDPVRSWGQVKRAVEWTRLASPASPGPPEAFRAHPPYDPLGMTWSKKGDGCPSHRRAFPTSVVDAFFAGRPAAAPEARSAFVP
eukprot:scaffold221_cov351-Pavlova_lutheri.AAC.2